MDLSNSANWQNAYEETLQLSNTPSFPDFVLPNPLSSPVIAIFVTTSAQKATWHTAGFLNQSTGISLAPAANWTTYSQRILLGGNIVFFPNNFPSYQLSFSFPYWFPNAFVSIWEYMGTDIENNESVLGQISQVTGDIASITTNVNEIIQQVAQLAALLQSLSILIGG